MTATATVPQTTRHLIGLLLGTEDDWPTAFEEILRRLGPIQDPAVTDRIAVPPQAAQPVALGAFLERLRDEAGVDVPFYYEANQLASRGRLPFPPSITELRTGLRDTGFHASRTHVRPEGIRTDAPRSTVERLARRLAEARQSQNARVRA